MTVPIYPRYRNRLTEQRSHELAVEENPRNAAATSSGGRKKRSLAVTSRLWQPGRTLWISFLGAPERSLKMAIFEVASEWVDLSGANLELDLAEDDDSRAQIRVLTGPTAQFNESDIGTDALDHEDYSISLTVTPDHPFFKYVVLHEFGHALGCQHEHQHPDADIPWNEAVVVPYYMQSQDWTEEDVKAQVLGKYNPSGLVKTEYDPTSIMHYYIPQEFTLGDWEVKPNVELSEKDLEFMRLAYPHD
ncbi:M12 family metallopeptidase [Pseudomonas tussilaginis]|uniref:M12 family metallopeptidase n=1 Tax=Pseudomonas sp. 5 TaxID=1619949 RepID=UPI0005EAE1AE|nr:M12 family metallopeptidase [Pseudomonas sp. 5]